MQYQRVVELLAGASTRKQYAVAKGLAAGCTRAEQLALVDHFLSASRRLGGSRV